MPRHDTKIATDDKATLAVIAEVLKEAREAAGLSQATAAAKIGVKRVTVIGWDNGTRCPSLTMFLRIAEGYNIKPFALLRKISERTVAIAGKG